MLQKRGGIAPRAVAVIVIIIVAVAGIAAYLVLTAPNSNSSSSSSLTPTKTSSTSSTPTTASSTTSNSTPTTKSSTSATSSTPTSSTSTTQTTAPSTSASATTLSTSCATTSTSSTQPASIIIPLLNAYSAITQTYQGTSNGTAFSFTASYKVVYESSTTYKVNITDVTPLETYNTTVWLLKDGTVIGLDIDGHNLNASATTRFQTFFSLWETALVYGQRIETYTSSSFLKSTGTSTVTLGPSTFTVTNYNASSLPETIPGCNGESNALTTGSFSVGTPSGSSYPLVTYFDAAGSETTVGISGTPSTTTYSFIGQITSVTVAKR